MYKKKVTVDVLSKIKENLWSTIPLGYQQLIFAKGKCQELENCYKNTKREEKAYNHTVTKGFLHPKLQHG